MKNNYNYQLSDVWILAKNCFDIAQPDLTFFGGFTEYLVLKNKINNHKKIIPHGYNTNITIAANLQVLTTTNEILPVEYSTSSSILRKSLTKEQFNLNSNGNIIINENYNGLGIELDWDIINKCKTK